MHQKCGFRICPLDGEKSMIVLRKRIAGVQPNTPAAKAGLKAGDVVTSLGGTQISSANELASVINAHKPGDRVTCVHVYGDFYRCNWWAPGAGPKNERIIAGLEVSTPSSGMKLQPNMVWRVPMGSRTAWNGITVSPRD